MTSTGARALPDPFRVPVAGPLRGAVRVPGSKSLTNRCLVLAALADGNSTLHGALDADDTRALARALAAMGAGVAEVPPVNSAWGVTGVGGRLRGGATLHCGDGGTPARFLMAAAALADAHVVIDGSARLRERPMADGGQLLAALGVGCTWLRAPGHLPVEIAGSARPDGGTVRVGRTASSQFVSALLLVAPWLAGGLRVEFSEPPVSESYLRLTIAELARWGVLVRATSDAAGALTAVEVPPGPPSARSAPVEADASSAVYWAAAAAIIPGSDLLLEGLSIDSPQPDMAAIHALGAMGARVTGSAAGVRVACGAGEPLNGIELACDGFPDGALAVIAASAVASGRSRFTGLGTLRVKECDRVHALAHNLRRAGVECTEGNDWLEVSTSDAPLTECTLPTFHDHRIAMAFAVLGMRTGTIAIENPACVAKSYPGFWGELAALCGAPLV